MFENINHPKNTLSVNVKTQIEKIKLTLSIHKSFAAFLYNYSITMD